ncbi:hypothetical protein [Aliarcobacter butzleri]|uniref:hypothetical protein n=1 Tax=Aliarcobacter butzleri TaxID=28197 RepID=UPI003AF77FE2
MSTNEEIQQGISELSIKIDDYYDFVQKIYKGNSDILSGTQKDVLLLDGTALPNLKKALTLFAVDKTNAIASLEQVVGNFGLEKQDLLNSLNQIINQFEIDKNNALSSLNQTELSKLTADVREVENLTYTSKRVLDIGVPGKPGFGLGDPSYVPDGWVRKMTANYIDKSGSWMCFLPISKIRIGHEASPQYATYGANTIEIQSLSAEEKALYIGKAFTSNNDYLLSDGFMIPTCFVDGGVFVEGNWFDKYKGGYEAGILKSKKGIQPIHCHTDGQYGPMFSQVIVDGVAATNRLDGAYKVVKSRGLDYAVPGNDTYSYLNLLVICQSQNATSSAEVAWMDKAPFLPKGNNNSLKDYDDDSVKYAQATGTNTGKSTTAAIENFEKTTHDGSILGIADLNGGMYEIASGFTRTTALGFLTIKKSIFLKDLTADSAFNVDNFNPLNVGNVITGNNEWISLGNGANAVYDNDIASINKIFNGIPKADGVSANGTNAFGKDGLYRYLAHEMVPLRSGSWGDTFRAGSGLLNVLYVRSNSNHHLGVRALRCHHAMTQDSES